MNEIVIKLPRIVTTDEIKFVSSEEIKAHYDALGKNVPFQWVPIPYVEIEGKWYAVIVKEAEKVLSGFDSGTKEQLGGVLSEVVMVLERRAKEGDVISMEVLDVLRRLGVIG